MLFCCFRCYICCFASSGMLRQPLHEVVDGAGHLLHGKLPAERLRVGEHCSGMAASFMARLRVLIRFCLIVQCQVYSKLIPCSSTPLSSQYWRTSNSISLSALMLFTILRTTEDRFLKPVIFTAIHSCPTLK